ncbi:hypothetical protein [Methylomonas sp. 11b]|uniref:hypothetical protein n=1 Tax=Methylomonas sp. 11b TaxID=1168169 RepID=UPI000478FA79|nr:hypothetical protein [Methylomonas sp. 11b]
MRNKDDQPRFATPDNLKQGSAAASETRICGGQPQTARCGGNTEDRESLGTGAPPSNTAPANYITDTTTQDKPGFQLLRCGVDSLYLSYRGELASGWDQRLEGLKRAAQSTEEGERSNAQVRIGEHLFEVRDKGKGRFAYVLVDNCFHIQLSTGNTSSLPLAYVQVSSEMLTALSVTEAEERLRYIINTLGQVKGEAQISRADLFADFLSTVAMDSWAQASWITRAAKIWIHYEKRQFTGWSIGLGGVMGCRLYNKTLELEKSKKDCLKPLWSAMGWQEGQSVWRLEFEFKRDALKELGVSSVDQLLASLQGLWAYATVSWLRLTIPNPDDENQSRWPNHPLWDSLVAVPWADGVSLPLSRLRKERLPSDESLFVNGLGGLTSFMAAHGMTDLGEGFGEFLAHANRFHSNRERTTGKTFIGYVSDKVKAKARKYNTLKNESSDTRREDEERKREQARNYKKVKDGD